MRAKLISYLVTDTVTVSTYHLPSSVYFAPCPRGVAGLLLSGAIEAGAIANQLTPKAHETACLVVVDAYSQCCAFGHARDSASTR